MPKMSKKLIKKFNFFLLFFILSFYSISHSSEKTDDFKTQNVIENIPILSMLIENKRDVVEFDSSNGKIISITFNSTNLPKKQILLFYKDFFEKNKWERLSNKNIWKTKSKRFNKKIFKIEDTEDNILIIKIIIENF